MNAEIRSIEILLTLTRLLCWRRFALRLFLSEQSQQHFLSGRGILRALGEQLYIKHDVFVVGVTRHFDIHGSCAQIEGCAHAAMVSELYCSTRASYFRVGPVARSRRVPVTCTASAASGFPRGSRGAAHLRPALKRLLLAVRKYGTARAWRAFLRSRTRAVPFDEPFTPPRRHVRDASCRQAPLPPSQSDGAGAGATPWRSPTAQAGSRSTAVPLTNTELAPDRFKDFWR
jgi:hypothetical protein